MVSLTSQHIERHFRGSAVVRDAVIGMSDGLTVPFALAAGLSGAVASSRIVVTAGLAEIAAGSIAMGPIPAGDTSYSALDERGLFQRNAVPVAVA